MQRRVSSIGVETSTLQNGRSGSRLTGSARRLWARVMAMTAAPHVDTANGSAARRDKRRGRRAFERTGEIVTHRRARCKGTRNFPANSVGQGIKFSLTIRETLVHNA